MSRDCPCEEGLSERTESSEGGCIPQKNEIRVIPSGSYKLSGQKRMYTNASGEPRTREAYNAWAKGLGIGDFDVAQAWFVDQNQGQPKSRKMPIPADVKL